jgi:serine/threonine protein kinase
VHKSSVAIKHLSFKTSQKAAYEAYVKEVAILEEISSHQNIVKLLDKKEAVSDEDIDAILILEYCIQNLSKIIASRRRKGEKGLPEQFILKIMYDITKGITELHDREPPIIHRDIRVGNILLGSDGNYKL